MNYKTTTLFEFVCTMAMVLVVCTFFFCLAAVPSSRCLLRVSPNPLRLEFPPISLHSGRKRGEKRYNGMWEITCATSLRDYTFKSEFESTWYPIPIYVKGFTIVQGFSAARWHWNMFFSLNMFFQQVSQRSLKVNLAKKLHYTHLCFGQLQLLLFFDNFEFLFFAEIVGQEVATFQQQQRLCSNFANLIFVVHFHRFCRSAAATWYLFMKFTSW